MNRCPKPVMKRRPPKKSQPKVAYVVLNPHPRPDSSLPASLSQEKKEIHAWVILVVKPKYPRCRARSKGRSSAVTRARALISPPKTAFSSLPLKTPLLALREVVDVPRVKRAKRMMRRL
ncbi:unnamed protein product [Microthlaspi erraticum]|uniref:Uncharacterized protein n=1 Tax=Microthlaspi erraticum TaxID=1685480 RepID=A0A6D2IC30_9BRAS|nr:unnamed protein product [Microthlaspi erraticum]